jgi:hypothetical protein
MNSFIDSELRETQVLYRTLDFFAATDIINNHSLMFSRADTFSDKNEGVDVLLRQLELRHYNSCLNDGRTDSESARKRHDQLKYGFYMSCWTQKPESIAMWSLYSQDLCGVRISTSVHKLGVALENLLDKHSPSRLTENHIGRNVIVSIDGRIAKVEYKSLSSISKRIARRTKAYRKVIESYKLQGRELPSFRDHNARVWQRREQSELKDLANKFNYKDLSFQHEAEVRVIAQLGEIICEKLVLEVKEPLNSNYPYLKEYLDACNVLKANSLPNFILSSCPNDFVETVAIDPRCPKHKALFMKNWFTSKGIQVVDSDCFGYIPDTFEVYPEK